MKLEHATITTPVGPFTVGVLADGALAHGVFEPNLDSRSAGYELVAREELGATTRALRSYFDGDVAAVDELPVTQTSGPFTMRAWEELRKIPAGAPISYGELARRAGNPTAFRAAGQACARNNVALVVPCHRVVRGDGVAHHFAWGVAVKRWLLDHELRFTTAAQFSS